MAPLKVSCSVFAASSAARRSTAAATTRFPDLFHVKHRLLFFPAALLLAFFAIGCIKAASPRGWAAPLENGATVLVSDSRFTQQIADECPGLDTHIRPPTRTLYQAAAEVIERMGSRTIGFESNHLTVADWEGFDGVGRAAPPAGPISRATTDPG